MFLHLCCRPVLAAKECILGTLSNECQMSNAENNTEIAQTMKYIAAAAAAVDHVCIDNVEGSMSLVLLNDLKKCEIKKF